MLRKFSACHRVRAINFFISKIHDINRLINKYLFQNGEKTETQDWYKCRGTAIITDGKEEQIKEIHWYQCENIGKVEFKTKEWGEQNAD